MKKTVIIVVIISILILGGFVWIQKSTQQHLKTLKEERARLEASEVERKKTSEKFQENVYLDITLFDLATLVDEWYGAGNKTRFELNKDNLSRADDIISDLRRKSNIDAEYYIYTTVANTVIRLRKNGSDSFYCLDTIQKQKQYISDNVVFQSPTTCSGQTLP